MCDQVTLTLFYTQVDVDEVDGVPLDVDGVPLAKDVDGEPLADEEDEDIFNMSPKKSYVCNV